MEFDLTKTFELPDGAIEVAQRIPITVAPLHVRLEPDSITGDPKPGVEARIADPAWLLGRQWQFGELIGEDAGSVVSVTVDSAALPVTAWAPLASDADIADTQWRPWHQGSILDEIVQEVPGLGLRGLRQRAEAGQQIVDLLEDAGEDDLAASLASRFPLAFDSSATTADLALDPEAGRLGNALIGTIPDGAAIAVDASAGAPAWLADASNQAAAAAALTTWLAWLHGASGSGDAWSTERLEYGFGMVFGTGKNSVAVRAAQFGSADIRWSDLEWERYATVDAPAGSPSGAPITSQVHVLATALRHPALPADRYWQLEDGAVDLGAIEAQPHDLGRLALAEFALTGGDDWLVVPVDGLHGALNRVTAVTLHDNFGDAVGVTEWNDPDFQMYRVSSTDGLTMSGVVLPPTSAGSLTGEAFEEVLFLRDEQANMAWAIEQTVQGPSGTPRKRAAEPAPERPVMPAGLRPEERYYRLQSEVPANWIPLVPIAPNPGEVRLRKGTLLRDGRPVHPVGTTLKPIPLTFPGEELPREGVQLRAVPMLARRADGTYVKWSAYRVRTGRGEAASRLAWDSALATTALRPPE